MATKKATTEEQVQEQATQEQTVTETAEAQAKAVSAPAAKPREAQAVAEVPTALESLSVLADRHRVPAWMQQALLRFMGWLDDKSVSDEEYTAALEQLKTRRIGGGRR
ncbi:MAG TPA: hypothetical protein H9894_10255 [Candidatus Desulfovibrio intestinipullorum]|uniref:Uncharacterized protein n=1 Tax=Candidatus Desulfovibrio intestinipullorum TaxID=2838536 RepID=A0A9D1TQL3_9BACT|nr:hypothetical protein [Candidatus Desulfovibrio intestinipullorum]